MRHSSSSINSYCRSLNPRNKNALASDRQHNAALLILLLLLSSVPMKADLLYVSSMLVNQQHLMAFRLISERLLNSSQCAS